MIFRVIHQTTYAYEEPASLSFNLGRLVPRPTSRQRILANEVTISPEPACAGRHTDFFGNEMLSFTIEEPHTELCIVAESVIETVAAPPPQLDESPIWEDVQRLFAANTHPLGPAELEAAAFLFASPLVPLSVDFAAFARSCFPPATPLLRGARNLLGTMFREFVYDRTATQVTTSVREVFARRRGVCQDFAHVLLGCFRSLGLPARYVSGYLETTPPPGHDKLVGADASHAWVAVYCPGLGWIDLDPTNDVIPGDQHLVLAFGRDYSDVPPLKGIVLGGSRQTLKIAVDVQRQDPPGRNF